jgi:dynein heavy chain
MRTKMLPSPTKFHYVFNLRDLSRVFQGVLRTPRASITNSVALVQLWRHECERVFSDKLTTLEDKFAFNEQLNACTKDLLTDPLGAPTGGSAALAAAASAAANAKGAKGSKAAKKDTAATASSKGGGDDVATYENVTATESFFVDFLRDDVYDDDGVLVAEAPKIYELGGEMEFLRDRVQVRFVSHLI